MMTFRCWLKAHEALKYGTKLPPVLKWDNADMQKCWQAATAQRDAEVARLREALEEAQIIFAPDQKGRYAMLTASLCERGHKLCTAAIREGE